MSAEPLVPVFYVTSQGVAFAPIPRARALVADVPHDRRPGSYSLRILDNPDISPLYKQRLVRQFLSKTYMEGASMLYAMEKRGSISAGPFTFETAEMKAIQISDDGKRLGYRFQLILERG
jgi:ATP-dependent Clp protease adapter protein ClpS